MNEEIFLKVNQIMMDEDELPISHHSDLCGISMDGDELYRWMELAIEEFKKA
jgi:hypothetical protein